MEIAGIVLLFTKSKEGEIFFPYYQMVAKWPENENLSC